ncbi:hypothetical protein [uncultured Ruminococcus sp.]|uniref:hypothetical protein n=1 Tax=uncultured Ruminococcus sp. TaxID=165186 RepID=UPI002601259B|nr:hypothetical protein [uncultured Ruminococcus sp.]
MEIWERYSKNVIEKFSIDVIAESFDKRYGTYIAPKDSDNFDFISPDKTSAIEITLVIPENEQKEYVYEIEKHRGKENLKTENIKNLRLDSQCNIASYYGGSMAEIKNAIITSLEKNNKRL